MSSLSLGGRWAGTSSRLAIGLFALLATVPSAAAEDDAADPSEIVVTAASADLDRQAAELRQAVDGFIRRRELASA